MDHGGLLLAHSLLLALTTLAELPMGERLEDRSAARSKGATIAQLSICILRHLLLLKRLVHRQYAQGSAYLDPGT